MTSNASQRRQNTTAQQAGTTDGGGDDQNAASPGTAQTGDDAPSGPRQGDMLFTIDDVPPWYTCALLGFQQFLTMLGNAVVVPLVVSLSICMAEDEPTRAYMVGSSLFVSGITTLLQTTFGSRLAIVQGPTIVYLPPILAMMKMPQWQCPDGLSLMTSEEQREVWLLRLNEVLGALLGASIVQTLIGLTGVAGLLLKIISPLVIATNLIVLGVGFYGFLGDLMDDYWPISITSLLLVVLFSLCLHRVHVPFPYWLPKRRGVSWVPLFKLLPVLLSILVTWALCAVLTAADVLPQPPPAGSNQTVPSAVAARTDTKLNLVQESAWFELPYPGKFGAPTFSPGIILGMTTAAFLSVIESIGDYYVCADISGASAPPVSAINRGISMEGLGGIVSSLLGSGISTTSYSNNIGIIGVTRVGSRRVIQWSGGMMIVAGLLTKFGAVFISVPTPVFGGAFVALFAMIGGMGISMLYRIDLSSTRNVFIIGLSILMSMLIPDFVSKNPKALETGFSGLDQVLSIILSTCLFVSFILACLMDNIIPGTDEERGLVEWKKSMHESNSSHQRPETFTYDMPFGMRFIRRWKWTRYVPFSPTFRGFPSPRTCKPRGSGKSSSSKEIPPSTVGMENGAYLTSVEDVP